ncbi:tRNA (cytidine(34)-2'-O)-methyltransferase [Novispirillum itersonii]|uniref:tRNA (cytidine(34)-2'-O)-methyltransferase n=1 Tax=Novispirillum itersonii TaxID=189 RepID=A0A7W9ZD31_NOVIT|nr:tRNA (cytidine(34)-2'-O)-methyltransferase [Novispirillum itersonii]MBB6208993.1 tRNA (cytidine/uridine-2'-O-)-methyltransferase [Novispirillum itersonii]
MRLALYQPDIPQNTGALLRLAACFDLGLDVIEPCGFVWDDRHLKRAGMDYTLLARMVRHLSWESYLADHPAPAGRLVLLTTRGAVPHHSFTFQATDTLLLGRESCGVPDSVHDRADARVVVPLVPAARSLNVVTAAAMVLAEALRQTGGYPCAGAPAPMPEADT